MGGKTRMVSLSDGEKSLRTCLAVVTQYQHVTDRQTDRQTDGGAPRSAIASRGKKDQLKPGHFIKACSVGVYGSYQRTVCHRKLPSRPATAS